MKCDLHLHSKYSWDSNVEIENYIRQAEKLNYQIISITDHNNIESHSIIDKLQSTTDVILLPGQEVSTKDGHLLVYGWIESLPSNLTMKKTIEIAKKSDCICIAAHPFDPFRGGSFSHIFETDIDGFELLNASSWFNFPNWLAQRAHKKNSHLLGLANSDSHRIEEFGSAYFTLSNTIDLPKSLPSMKQLQIYFQETNIHGKRLGFLKKLTRLFKRL